MYTGAGTVEWSDLLFFMFENGHTAAVQINYKKSANFAARASKFSSSKNHWDLKNEYFASGATYKSVFFCAHLG